MLSNSNAGESVTARRSLSRSQEVEDSVVPWTFARFKFRGADGRALPVHLLLTAKGPEMRWYHRLPYVVNGVTPVGRDCSDIGFSWLRG